MMYKKMRKPLTIFFSVILLLLSPLSSLAATSDIPFDSLAQAAIAIDADSGQIFYEKNSQEPLPIASMTKLISFYLILEAIHNGELSWDETMTINEHLYELSHNTELSNVFLAQNHHYTIEDLFDAAEKVSANAAIIALSERVAGSEVAFVDKMREKVEEWGIHDAYLISTSGINNEDARGQIYPGSGPNEENLMSARDMALVIYHLIHDFPEILDDTSQPTALFAEGTPEEVILESTNAMLPGMAFETPGVQGLKTGTTELAGTNFAGLISRDQRRVITVVMHVEEYDEDTGKRFEETQNLMNYALDDWEQRPIVEPDAIYQEATTDYGTKPKVTLHYQKGPVYWLPKNQSVQTEFVPDEHKWTKNNTLKMPIQQSEVVGHAVIKLPGTAKETLFDQTESVSIPIYAGETIEPLPFLQKIVKKTQTFFQRLF